MRRFDTYRPGLRWWFILLLAVAVALGFARIKTREPSEPSLDESSSAATVEWTLRQGQGVLRYDTEYPVIGYSTTAASDPIAELQARIDRGDVRLEFAGHRGYLDSLLQVLEIDVSSQVLVFSKTSLQAGGIHSGAPRAIYFNDDTYVAWVQETAALEIASMDPKLGPVFYLLDLDPDVEVGPERQFRRCLECHDSYSLTGGGVPRFLTGSGYTGESGDLVSHEGHIITTHRTPLRSRWGGWYVSGHHGEQVHLGNIVVRDIAELQHLEQMRVGNLEDLDGLLETSPYLSNKSDIVALLVFEHQVTVQNAITRFHYDTRMALFRAEQGGESADTGEIASLAEALVEALFLVDEGRITGPISGTSGFAEEFEARGRADRQGRSLRELDLIKRLFKYPLSYLVHSAAFDALPEVGKRQVYLRIAAILRGEDQGENFAHLSLADRTAIFEILRDTKPEFVALSK